MHMKEKALTEKVNLGSEVLNNTLWGVNTSYNTEFQWLTSWLNKIPTVTATAPSRLSLTAEFAQLIPSEKKNASSLSYLGRLRRIPDDHRHTHALLMVAVGNSFDVYRIVVVEQS